ncbi:MAG: hypothetical protein U9N32_04180 [Spirochaetota bacterium]|nr:hypothetical protein [Spirochaetota bacterium]
MSGLNWYSYTSNNPVKYVDPTGLAEIYADDIHGNPILAWDGRDIKNDTSVEVERSNQSGDENDTARVKIGNQTLSEYSGVQSEKKL